MIYEIAHWLHNAHGLHYEASLIAVNALRVAIILAFFKAMSDGLSRDV